ncbi:MAG: MjaI family restriction endonuclease [Chitinispirillaceae bacterium]|nr:MjaI family restriction endonuclease [Chitinispirillaceae bacterium]
METKIIIGDSRKMVETMDESIALIVTSPPYWNIKDYGLKGQIGYGQTYTPKNISNILERFYLSKLQIYVKAEIEEITEEDCIKFIYNLVINRTFDGYQSEIQTIYGQLQNILDIKIEAAPDEWDRGFNVDYYTGC